MPNLLQRGASFLSQKSQTAGGRAGIYRRGQSQILITLVPKELNKAVLGTEGIQTAYDSFTWQMTASELLLNGELTTPRQGDTWEYTEGGKLVRWKVLPKSENEKAVFDPDAGTGMLLFVHMKRDA